MAQLIQLNCHQCGATLEIEANRKYCFCSYCGAKAFLDDGNTTTRIIDDARIREAEANEKVKLRQAEVELQRIKAETAALERIRLQQTQANLELDKQRIAAQQIKDEKNANIRIAVIGIVAILLILTLIFFRMMTL